MSAGSTLIPFAESIEIAAGKKDFPSTAYNYPYDRTDVLKNWIADVSCFMCIIIP